jgi:uncharacterized protein (TIGR02598 family)
MDTLNHTDPRSGVSRGGHWLRRAGFSLVEVTLALGVVGFAFVPILGLLPVGLTAFHQSMGMSISTQIAQRVLGEAQQTDFTTLTSGAAIASRYFDEEGSEIKDSSSTKWIYVANTVVKIPPSDQAGGLACTNLVNVLVQVVGNPSRKALATGTDGLVPTSTGISIQTYAGIVSSYK